MIAARYADKVPWLKQYLGHIDFDTRESVSRLLGIASCALPLDTLSNVVQDLISSVSAAPKLRL